jgi:cyclic pyranopterin phosphate synthase
MSMDRPLLIDRFGRRHNYLRISVTDRCNFRCAYCMPHEDMEWAPRAEILTFEEIERLAILFSEMGVDKVRLTGGEPTTRKGLVELVTALSGIERFEKLLLTTNGDAMGSMAGTLRVAGITGVNISLDTLHPGRFFDITHRNRLDRVLAGIDAALKAGFQTVKLNVVVMAGVNDDELCDFLERFKDVPLEVRFIEFMPFLSNGWQKGKMLAYAEIRRRIESKFRLTPVATDDSAVAKEFSVDGAQVKVGFITSMTDSFCGGCNRIRLTADGRLKVCLFAKTGPSLRDAMRLGASDDELAETIRHALDGKWAAHPPMDQLVQTNDLPMISIGG